MSSDSNLLLKGPLDQSIDVRKTPGIDGLTLEFYKPLWPVSLLCTDYKILSKALANWLREVMDQVVHQDQTLCTWQVNRWQCLLNWRCFGCLWVTGFEYWSYFNRSAESIWLSWTSLSLEGYESFGFSKGLIAKIKVLYQNIESVLKLSGGLCAPFEVRRYIRQGCTLSGMLYAIFFELMLQKMESYLGVNHTWFQK